MLLPLLLHSGVTSVHYTGFTQRCGTNQTSRVLDRSFAGEPHPNPGAPPCHALPRVRKTGSQKGLRVSDRDRREGFSGT